MAKLVSKLNLITSSDDFRPALQYVVINNGYFVATNAHLLVKQHLSLHGFTDEEIGYLNGKAIHKELFLLMPLMLF